LKGLLLVLLSYWETGLIVEKK